MKRLLVWTAVVAALATAGLRAEEQPQPGGQDVKRAEGARAGGAIAWGQGKSAGQWQIASLDKVVGLTEAQKKSIGEIYESRDKAMHEIQAVASAKFEAARKAMQEAAAKGDSEARSKAQKVYQEAYAPMHDLMKKTQKDVEALLTPEQAAKLAKSGATHTAHIWAPIAAPGGGAKIVPIERECAEVAKPADADGSKPRPCKLVDKPNVKVIELPGGGLQIMIQSHQETKPADKQPAAKPAESHHPERPRAEPARDKPQAELHRPAGQPHPPLGDRLRRQKELSIQAVEVFEKMEAAKKAGNEAEAHALFQRLDHIQREVRKVCQPAPPTASTTEAHHPATPRAERGAALSELITPAQRPAAKAPPSEPGPAAAARPAPADRAVMELRQEMDSLRRQVRELREIMLRSKAEQK